MKLGSLFSFSGHNSEKIKKTTQLQRENDPTLLYGSAPFSLTPANRVSSPKLIVTNEPNISSAAAPNTAEYQARHGGNGFVRKYSALARRLEEAAAVGC